MHLLSVRASSAQSVHHQEALCSSIEELCQSAPLICRFQSCHSQCDSRLHEPTSAILFCHVRLARRVPHMLFHHFQHLSRAQTLNGVCTHNSPGSSECRNATASANNIKNGFSTSTRARGNCDEQTKSSNGCVPANVSVRTAPI